MPKKKENALFFFNEIMMKLESSTNEGFFQLILIFGDLKIRYSESAGCRDIDKLCNINTHNVAEGRLSCLL